MIESKNIVQSWINLRWPVMGDRIPSDHNYRLYSALIGKIPQLKEIDWQLGTITGIPDHAGWVKLGRKSTLLIRCKFPDLNLFSPLDSNIIRVGQTLIELGQSEGESIQPADTLKSRIVTIKTVDCRIDPFAFGVSLGKQLSEMGVQSIPVIGDRKTIRIKDTTVVGYGLEFAKLDNPESIVLQSMGLGGRRKIGAGVFV